MDTVEMFHFRVSFQALLNLGSPDPWLRVAAYKLLCAVKETFKLQIDYHLDESHSELTCGYCCHMLLVVLHISHTDLSIPMNSCQFVLDVSQQLAMKEAHLTLEVTCSCILFVLQSLYVYSI